MPGCVGLYTPPLPSLNSFAYSLVPDTRSPPCLGDCRRPAGLPPQPSSSVFNCTPGSQPKTALASWGPNIPTQETTPSLHISTPSTTIFHQKTCNSYHIVKIFYCWYVKYTISISISISILQYRQNLSFKKCSHHMFWINLTIQKVPQGGMNNEFIGR